MRRPRGICCSCLVELPVSPEANWGERGKGRGVRGTYVRPDAFHANAIVCYGWWGCVEVVRCGFAGASLN